MSVPARAVAPTLLQVDAILHRLAGADGLGELCRFLRASFAHYRWVGVYALAEDTLELVAWDGEAATEHARIPVGQGICGRAVRENRTVIVDDVTREPDYLACFLETKSEIVVPVRAGSRVVGEIDIDGNERAAYDATDQRLLEAIAEKIASSVSASMAGAAPRA